MWRLCEKCRFLLIVGCRGYTPIGTGQATFYCKSNPKQFNLSAIYWHYALQALVLKKHVFISNKRNIMSKVKSLNQMFRSYGGITIFGLLSPFLLGLRQMLLEHQAARKIKSPCFNATSFFRSKTYLWNLFISSHALLCVFAVKRPCNG